MRCLRLNILPLRNFDRDVFFVHILIDNFAERQRNTSKWTVCSPLLRCSWLKTLISSIACSSSKTYYIYNAIELSECHLCAAFHVRNNPLNSSKDRQNKCTKDWVIPALNQSEFHGAVVIFNRNFCPSKWCLSYLTQIQRNE